VLDSYFNFYSNAINIAYYFNLSNRFFEKIMKLEKTVTGQYSFDENLDGG